MAKQNCWEFMKCGREPGGMKAAEMGVCPAATESRLNGINDGQNGGRSCWAIPGTLGGGKRQGNFVSKIHNCLDCNFFKLVVKEEGPRIHDTGKILDLIRPKKTFNNVA